MLKSQTASYRNRNGEEVTTHFLRGGSGATVVLIHGVGMSAGVWAPQLSALASKYNVVAIDMLGHGQSSLPSEDVSLHDYAEQVVSVLDHIGVSAAHIMGHSMGALVALEFALTHRAKVKSVVALNAVFRRNQAQRASVASRLAALDDGGSIENEQTITRWFGNPVPERWRAAAEEVRANLTNANAIGYRRTYKLFSVSDAAHEKTLSSLEVPALFFTGSDDPNSSPLMSRIMAGTAAQGRYDVLANERHMMNLTAPDEVNRRLIAFLDEVEAGTRPVPVDPQVFRKALGGFVTGITVVATMQDDGEPRGFTANSFTSVSLDPPLILICIAKNASSYGVFSRARYFSVNVLSEAQADVSRVFYTPNIDRFTKIGWRKGSTGSPILDGTTAWFDCSRYDAVDAGDHMILIGRVEDFGDATLNPLGYCRGAHVAFGLPLNGSGASVLTVGAILESEEKILFVSDNKGGWVLPSGASLGPESDKRSLAARLTSAGIKADLSFLFAVFEDPRSGASSIFYRGTISEMSEISGSRLVRIGEIPWDTITDDATCSMLQRYVRERQHDSFGVYVGGLSSGVIKTLA